ncbi:MAG: S8 family serine peptidase [Actinobacteria bacterium]|nr:S8 family serine peptidase [Actinomycetota bacterium]
MLTAPLMASAAHADDAAAATPYVVTFADGSMRSQSAGLLSDDVTFVGPRAAALRLTPEQATAVAGRADVVRVEPDVVFHTLGQPNDPCLTSCLGTTDWGIPDVDAYKAWDYSTGAGVTIGILDSGIDVNHPDLAAKIVGPEIDETAGAGRDPLHGTGVAGTAAAVTNNGLGIPGMGWDSKILDVRVIDDSGAGLGSWVARGLYDATDRGVKVINLSLGSPDQSQTVQDAVNYALGHGVVVVAAAGNDGSSTPIFPADYPGVLSVGANDTSDNLTNFTNRAHLDLSAPGVNLPVTAPNNSYKLLSGTSFSAPMASGAAALLVAQGLEKSPTDVDARLTSTGVPLKNSPTRKLDAGNALALLDAYPGFGGGVHVATGDLTGDQGSEIVTGAGPGGGPHVKLFTNQFGLASPGFFAYDPNFHGGVNVAVGDVEGTGHPDIITGPGPGGGPNVRVFRPDGTPVASFFAYDPRFAGGVTVAAADLDGDGKAEIITGPGPGGGPHVRAFHLDGTQVSSFFAYAPNFGGGVSVSAAQLGSGNAQIVTGPGAGGGPDVRTFNQNGQMVGEFFAYSAAFLGGVNVAAFKTAAGPRILTGAGSGGGPHVRLLTPDGTVIGERFGFPTTVTGGVSVAFGPDGPLIGEGNTGALVRFFPF